MISERSLFDRFSTTVREMIDGPHGIDAERTLEQIEKIRGGLSIDQCFTAITRFERGVHNATELAWLEFTRGEQERGVGWDILLDYFNLIVRFENPIEYEQFEEPISLYSHPHRMRVRVASATQEFISDIAQGNWLDDMFWQTSFGTWSSGMDFSFRYDSFKSIVGQVYGKMPLMLSNSWMKIRDRMSEDGFQEYLIKNREDCETAKTRKTTRWNDELDWSIRLGEPYDQCFERVVMNTVGPKLKKQLCESGQQTTEGETVEPGESERRQLTLWLFWLHAKDFAFSPERALNEMREIPKRLMKHARMVSRIQAPRSYVNVCYRKRRVSIKALEIFETEYEWLTETLKGE
jgi:hypothetical protein